MFETLLRFMITKGEISQFYKDVEALGLRFPGAEISKATGQTKSAVSAYLNKKKTPSERFLKAFYKAYEGSINVSREKMTTYSNIPPFQTKTVVSDQEKSALLKKIADLEAQVQQLMDLLTKALEKR